MKIAVDARMLNMSGIGTYIQNLMKNDCYSIALGNEKDIKSINNKVDVINFNSPIYGIKEQLKFPYRKLRELKPDVLHVPHYNIPIFYRGKMVVTIHDVTHLVLPEFLPNKFAKYYAKFMMWLAIKKSSKILTVSENTKKDLIRIFKVKSEKIEVILNGVGEEFVKKDKEIVKYLYDKFNIPKDKKILMYVGNLKPHKNLERLLEAYSKTSNMNETCLLLVGKAFEKYNGLEDKENSLGIKKNVIHTGIVSKEELVDLYNLADLFIFPSLYEGFGLPILEALCCGTPVISSNTSSMPEVGLKYVKYFNPYNVQEITEQIENGLLENSNDELNVRKKIHSKFDWNTSSSEHKRILERLI
ncbi:MAG: glycosyltransferase family 4 protein [Clostridia bacterium]|nr:glycosyltransferase family 4 protein [Clostridia bacterium]